MDDTHVESEFGKPHTEEHNLVAGKIDEFTQPKEPELIQESNGSLAEELEFCVAEKTSPAINANLADIVSSLLNEKLTKEKLGELQSKSLRPKSCSSLVAPKINKQIWQQLRQETRN